MLISNPFSKEGTDDSPAVSDQVFGKGVTHNDETDFPEAASFVRWPDRPVFLPPPPVFRPCAVATGYSPRTAAATSKGKRGTWEGEAPSRDGEQQPEGGEGDEAGKQDDRASANRDSLEEVDDNDVVGSSSRPADLIAHSMRAVGAGQNSNSSLPAKLAPPPRHTP